MLPRLSLGVSRGEFRLKYGTFSKKVPYFSRKSTVHFAKSTVLLAGGGLETRERKLVLVEKE